MRRIAARLFRSSAPVARNRRLAAEALERRSMLCGVTCELTDGVLSVLASEGEDSIAVRLDDSRTIEVRDAGQLVGSFPADQVRNVKLLSVDSNDRVEIDPAMTAAVFWEQADGESALAGPSAPPSSTGSSQEIAPTTAADRMAAHAGLHGSAAEAAAVAANEFSTGAAAFGFAAALPFVDATAQRAPSTSNESPSSNVHHAAHTIGGPTFVSVVSSSGDHSHGTSVGTAVPSTTVGGAAAWGGSTIVARIAARDAGSGHHPGAAATKAKESAELAPKWCTTTPYTKVLIANVDRKPECWCEDEKQAGGADKSPFAFLGAGDEGSQFSLIVRADGGAGASCRSTPWLAALQQLTVDEICSERSESDVLDEIRRANGDGATGGDSAAQRATATDLALAEAAFWSDSDWQKPVRYAGWAMVAAGAAMLPVLLIRERRDEREESGWAKGGFELLPA